MPKLRSTDDLMKDYLLSTQSNTSEIKRDARIEAADPGYLKQPSTRKRDVYAEQEREFGDVLLANQDRDLGEHLQDMGAGLMGTFGAIGNTAILGVAAAGDALGNLTGTNEGWDATQDALQGMSETHKYWNSLQSEKSAAFDRITQYRQDRAIEQLGADASLYDRLTAGFGAGAGAYIDNPGQIVTDGVAQLPYLMTGGLAKGLTTGTAAIRTGAIGVTAKETTSRLAAPLINQMVARGMTAESAIKLVQMGLVGGMQGTIEGADAASSAYERVMSSVDTFGPQEQAARESAALRAAAKAFGIAGATSAITGTLASKFDLSPFSSAGSGVLGRTGDNIIKALQEGFQESIESGTSQFATNYAGNTELGGKDLVALDEGVGGAAGTGAVVGMGSTAITNPRSVIDAGLAPLTLVGKGFSYMGNKAEAKERRADMAAAMTTVDDVLTVAETSPAVTQILNDANSKAEVTTETPAAEVELPESISTKSPLHLFASGMEYLKGKDMNSEDVVTAFHVLGAVMESAVIARNVRDNLKKVAEDPDAAPEDREAAQKKFDQLRGLINDEKLNAWVDEMPMEKIDGYLDQLLKNPEEFGSTVAQLAVHNPMKVTAKMLETAYESKSLTPKQRNSILLAQELKAAEADLKVSGAPDSEGVSRSMLQTGFPGAKENDSVAGYIRKITQSIEEGDTDSAQVYFNRLVKFSNYELARAGAYEAAKKALAADPDSKPVTVEGYATFNKKTGKLDKSLPPVVNKSEGSLALVKAVRKDADTIAKMVAAIQKRTGLQAVEKAPESTPAPAAVKEATPTPAKVEKPAEKPASPPVAEETDPELAAMTDEAIGQEMEALAQAISRRRNNNTGKAVEQDVRYDNLVRETARRMGNASKPATPKAVEQPVTPVVATNPVTITYTRDDGTQTTQVHEEGSRGHKEAIEHQQAGAQVQIEGATAETPANIIASGTATSIEMWLNGGAIGLQAVYNDPTNKERLLTVEIGSKRLDVIISNPRNGDGVFAGGIPLDMEKNQAAVEKIIGKGAWVFLSNLITEAAAVEKAGKTLGEGFDFLEAEIKKFEKGKPAKVETPKTQEPAAAEAVAETRNPENPFKDSVVQGLVYHATANATDLENIQVVRPNTGNQWMRGGLGKGVNTNKVGFYTTRNLGYAAAVAGATIPIGVSVTTAQDFENNVSEKNGVELIPFYVNLRNPYLVKDNDTIEITSISEKEMAELQAQGYDGMLFEDPAFRYEEVVVFDASQLHRLPSKVASEPSKNHFEGLQPSYPVADGASVAEQNDAKNHLSQSFTSSDQPGLRSKGEALTNFNKLVEDTGIVDEDIPALEALFNTKEKLLQRMQQLIGIGGAAKAKHFLKNNVWGKAKYHFLYATQWDEKKGIQYQKEIAEIMAWTGVQHLMDMVAPVSWSNDLIQKLQSTYGNDIREKMLDGWVPLKEQTEQVARKLQTNLELKGDKKISVEYTEGTMLALAGRIIESMIANPNYNGVIQHQTIMTLPVYDKKNPNVIVGPALPIQWVRMSVNKDSQKNADMLYAAARILQDFLPERTSTNQAHVGTPPKGVNPFYRGSLQKIGKEQKAALKARANVKHMLSPLLHNMWQALPQTEQFFRLFGMDMSVKDFPTNKRDLTVSQIGRKGANNTTYSDLRVIHNHIQKLKDFAEAQEGDVDLHSIPSFFEYEQVSNGRAMTKGTSPQSSKWYREMFAIAQYQVDPTKENRGFRMAVAQGFGIKMDIQHIDESLQKLEVLLTKPDMQRALQAAERFGEKFDYSDNALLLEADLAAFEQLANPEGLGIELSPHAMSALVHYAQYQKPGKQPFTSSLMYEIDGKTDGPINLMMLLGLKGSAADMEAMLGLAGLFFDQDGSPIAVQDMTEQLKAWNNNKKDLYEIITGKAQTLTPKLYNVILKTVVDKAEPKFKNSVEEQASQLMDATLHLVRLAGLGKFNAESLLTEYERAFSKKSTQAAGYLQGGWSVSTDLFNTIIEKVSELKDADKLTNGDKEAIKVFFTYALGSTTAGGVYFSYSPKAYKDHQGRPFVWEGKPLNKQQQDTAISTLNTFIGKALFTGLEDTIGLQRANMLSAVTAMSAHISYADHVLRTRYIAKQKELTDKGELLPGQALSKVDEQVIVKDVWEKLVPHPLLRNTAGLPTASLDRNNGNPLTGSLKLDGSRRIENRYFEAGMGEVFSHFSGLTEVMFEDPGVSFAALSIMTAGDGSMMTGLFNKMRENILDMYDGLYMSPEIIDEMGDALNHEVKANWEHDFIGSILDSAKSLTTPEFKAWASSIPVGKDRTLLDNVAEAEAQLRKQREQQIKTLADINSRPHWVSHMAGHGKPAYFPGKPLNSTTLGTSITDPLLDLASDELGTVTNGIRKLSAADVKKLLQDHTFENPVLSGLWKVLAPLVSDNLTVFLSSDKQGMAEFYQQNERREMSMSVDGVSVGDRVYVRAVNAETIVHELLHATTKNLTATYFSKPEALTAKQREAMKNLLALQSQFMELDAETLSPMQQAMVEHTQSIMRNLDPNSALQEFLAYGLSNYHLQRTLGNTKSKLGQLMESVFNAVKALFGFPNGTQSDSMLAQMFSNFATLTEGTQNITYPVSVEDALNAVNLDLARRFGNTISQIVAADAVRTIMNETQGQAGSATVKYAAQGIARDRLNKIAQEARTRMQELADTNLFPSMTNEEQAAAEYLQAVFAAGLQIKSDVNSLLARVVDAVRAEGAKAWGTDPALAQARFDYFFENNKNQNDRAADILSMALVSPEFSEYMEKIVLPSQDIDKSTLNNWLDSTAQKVYELTDTGLAIKKDSSLAHVLEVAAIRMQKSMMQSAKRKEAQPGMYRRLTEKLSEGVHLIGEKAGNLAEARMKLKGTKDWINSSLVVVAGLTNDRYADMLGKLTLSLTNELDADNPFREVMQEMVGTVGDNYKLIQLKGIAARMVSAIRQTFREQVPATVKGWFTDLTPEQDELLHKVIGKMAAYSLSQNLKDRMEELLTNPANAMRDAKLLLENGGNLTKRRLMIKYAEQLGDRMANKGTQALYLNTRAVAGLAVHGGGDVLTADEMAALENLSTLQALSHLTGRERRQVLELYRNNTEGFWKTSALINAFHNFDTQRAGQNTATLNFQKGWIPVETDGRKKLKLFQKSEVLKAQRMGWVQVGEFADDPNLVYMATTVGKTPTLSGGAIHSVDFHMNGIHYHSGLPTDPSIQTLITHPKAVSEIKTRILNGEVMPYTALYDAAGDVEGFQRQLDPAMMDRHTKTVGRISDAAGIWLGRLHEERVAHSQNQAAADLLRKTWDDGQKDKREHEFVNIRQPVDLKDPNAKQDKVLLNVWQTLPYHTKVQLESAFADGSRNPPIWIRKDQLNDAIGYHKASVGNFFTGDNRYEKSTNANVAALSRQMLGKNAYKYLKTAEEGWQALIGSAKDTIIVKSLVVALNNLASNQTQLFMITGNPVWNLRVQSQKHKELVSYLGYQQRHARLVAEKYATSDANAIKRIQAEQVFLEGEMRKLSIWPLIEAGEMPTIAEGLSETEEFSMVGDFTEWAEKQMGKLPPVASTILNNLAVSKETSLYKGLDRMVQYGDFVAKATMYEWLTTQDANARKQAFDMVARDTSKKLTMDDALKQVALMEVNDEFVNYARLAGRWRTYGEDMGLLWFYNYKLRIIKMSFRRMRKNPAAFIIGSQVGAMLGVSTLIDTLPQNINFSYSTGLDPLFSAHQTILWNQMF